jgi:transaldolase
MKIYIDSAAIHSWKLPSGAPRPVGVTTNPTLVQSAGLPVSAVGYRELVAAAIDHGFSELMLQVTGVDAKENTAVMEKLKLQAERGNLKLTVKIPCDARWSETIVGMQALQLPTLLTALSNPLQLLWAMDQKANWVAPYVGRLTAAGYDVWALIGACVSVQERGPLLLAASIKTADVLARLVSLGAAAATLAPEFIAGLCRDQLTQDAINQFNSAVNSDG